MSFVKRINSKKYRGLRKAAFSCSSLTSILAVVAVGAGYADAQTCPATGVTVNGKVIYSVYTSPGMVAPPNFMTPYPTSTSFQQGIPSGAFGAIITLVGAGGGGGGGPVSGDSGELAGIDGGPTQAQLWYRSPNQVTWSWITFSAGGGHGGQIGASTTSFTYGLQNQYKSPVTADIPSGVVNYPKLIDSYVDQSLPGGQGGYGGLNANGAVGARNGINNAHWGLDFNYTTPSGATGSYSGGMASQDSAPYNTGDGGGGEASYCGPGGNGGSYNSPLGHSTPSVTGYGAGGGGGYGQSYWGGAAGGGAGGVTLATVDLTQYLSNKLNSAPYFTLTVGAGGAGTPGFGNSATDKHVEYKSGDGRNGYIEIEWLYKLTGTLNLTAPGNTSMNGLNGTKDALVLLGSD